MAVVLSPAPTTPAAMLAARQYLGPQIGMDPADADRLDALIAVASELVEREAPGAPQSVRNEAVVRAAGYLRQSDYGGIRREEIGPKSAEYVTNHTAWFRNCGAAALLSRWKIRRAGSIG